MPGSFSWSDRDTFAGVTIRTVVRGSHSATLSAVGRTWLPTGLTRSDRSLRPMTTSRTVGCSSAIPFPRQSALGNADGCFGSEPVVDYRPLPARSGRSETIRQADVRRDCTPRRVAGSRSIQGTCPGGPT